MEEEHWRGRRSSLTSIDKLGLYLHHVNSTMKMKTLSQLFGVPPSTVSRAIAEVSYRICEYLIDDPDCRIRWPTIEEQRILADKIKAREPDLEQGAFAFVDGCSFPCEVGSTIDEQNAYYNSWKGGTFVNNLFVFSPTGKIIFAALNAPGSWHDAQLCLDLLPLLLDPTRTAPELGIIADTAFPRTGPLEQKILTPSSFDSLSINTEVAYRELLRHQLITSLRQSAEWGMRALQGTFGRLKVPQTHHHKKRSRCLLSIALLHNFRTTYVGFNQIATVFADDYEQSLHNASYDRIARFYRI